MKKKHKRRTHTGKKSPSKADLSLEFDLSLSSRAIFAFLASIILLLGFFAIKDYAKFSVGKAYEIEFQEQEFNESVNVNLLADVPEKLLLTVKGIVKNANLKLAGSGTDLIISINDDPIFASAGRLSDQTFVIDTFDGAAEKTISTPDYIILKIPKGASIIEASIKVEEKTNGAGQKEENLEGITIEKNTTEDGPKEIITEGLRQEETNVVNEPAKPSILINGNEASFGIRDISNFIITECEENICTSELNFTSDANISLVLSGIKVEYGVKVRDFSAEINKECSEYPCTVPINIVSRSDGTLNLGDISIVLEGKKEMPEELENPKEAGKPEEPKKPKNQTCETSLDCPVYNKCEKGECVNFCEDKPAELKNDTGGKRPESDSSALVSKLNKLGYSVVGKADIPNYNVQKSGNKIVFSSRSDTHIFDQSFDSFILSDGKGNKMAVQKLQGQVKKTKPSHIVEFRERPLLAVKSDLEKEFGLKVQTKSPPKNIKEKVEAGLIKYKEELKGAREKALEEMQQISPSIESKIIDQYKNTFNGISLDLSEKEALEIKKLSSVKDVYLNEEVNAVLEESVNQIGAGELWKILDGVGNSITGKGVTIGVIDTGVDYTHQDLGGCLGNGCKVIGGYDFVNRDNDPMDDQGHGTHVASTAAGNGVLKGVAPDAQIVAYKVLNAGGSGSFSDVIEAIERSADPNQDGDFSDHLDIISLSLGGSGNPDDPVSKAIDNVVNAGVTAVVAAGNAGPDTGTIGSPGAARKAITVGAVDKCDKIAGFSSRGPVSWDGGILLKPDIVAPGVEICAALLPGFEPWKDNPSYKRCVDNKHVLLSGTSMATPEVSGAAALLMQSHPDWTPEMVKSALMTSAFDLGLDAATQGAGRINVFDANDIKIIISPNSLSFEFDKDELSHTETISVKNLLDTEITLTLKIIELKDENGGQYDFASLNTTSLTINGNSSGNFNFIVDPKNVEGVFSGKILISLGNSEYTVPFLFEKFSKLTVKATAAEYELSPSFLVHDENFAYVDFAQYFFDFIGNNFTFKIPSGKYTAYAIGDSESELDYILIGTAEVPPNSDAELELSLGKARPFIVKAESLQGKPLKLYQWSKGFRTYNNENLVGMTYNDPTLGNRTVYISNKPDNGVDTDILLYLQGVPARDEDLRGNT